MTLPVPRSLQPKKKARPEGAVGIQAVSFHKLQVGRFNIEYTFRPTHFVLHVFTDAGPYPLKFGEKLRKVIYNGWPGAKEVQVEWIEDLRSFCVRIHQQERPVGWGNDEIDTMLTEGLG